MSVDERVVTALHDLMGKKNFLQGKNLAHRVSDKAGIEPLEAKHVLGRLARQGILIGVTDRGEAFGRVLLTVAAPVKQEPTSFICWKMAMKASGVTEDEMQALASCHDRLDGFSDADMRDLARGLLAMRSAQEQDKGTPRFVLSARYLLGSSKILGSLPVPALRTFGIDIDAMPDAIPQVIVAGPACPESVLLIENPHSFEEAVAAGCAERIALIVTYGYGLSRSGEAYGSSLTEAVEQAERLVPLVRFGNPPSPIALLGHSRIHFWGDLDREGLRIYASLRKNLPALCASALYIPMVEAMKRGESHPYVKATAKERQGIAAKVPDDVSNLVALCAERGVDQEIVRREDIVRLGTFSFMEVV